MTGRISTEYFGPVTKPVSNADVGAFVCHHIWGKVDAVKDYCSMGVFRNRVLIAGTLYHNYYPDAGVIELTSASISRRWLTRPVIKAMFSLPFDAFKCQLVVLRVSQKNPHMLKIARAFGFSEYVIPRLRGRDEDEHVFTLTDDAWREHRVLH